MNTKNESKKAVVLFTHCGSQLRAELRKWEPACNFTENRVSGSFFCKVPWGRLEPLFVKVRKATHRTASGKHKPSPWTDFFSAIFPSEQSDRSDRVVLGQALMERRRQQDALPRLSTPPAEILARMTT